MYSNFLSTNLTIRDRKYVAEKEMSNYNFKQSRDLTIKLQKYYFHTKYDTEGSKNFKH